MIEMVDCREFLDEGKYANKTTLANKILLSNLDLSRKKDASFICPSGKEREMSVQGTFGSEVFEYVKLSLKGCTLGDQCLSDEEITSKSFNFVSLSSHA